MVAVLRELAGGALRPAELERRLPAAHSVLGERLRRLLEEQLVSYERQAGMPPHAHAAAVPHQAHYGLSDAGRMLLEVTGEACRWEAVWYAPLGKVRPTGVLAIELIADQHTRKLLLLLADGPLCTAEMDARALDLGRSALRRRLHGLVLAGLLKEHRLGRTRRYELTPGARHLALVAMLAGRWEWQWWRPARLSSGADLSSLLRILAPAAHMPEPVSGICRLHLDAGGAGDPDIYLAARAGSLLALADTPVGSPQAVGHGTPEAWCDALLLREGPIEVSGNQALLSSVIGALNTALLA
jgi:DNA-binding HxlR family transcriptional regulator